MLLELNPETPVVGCEIILIGSVHSKAGYVIPDDSLDYNWYRLQNEERLICWEHPSQIATFQCRACAVSGKHVKETFHCTVKCYNDHWLNHHKSHPKVAASLQMITEVENHGYDCTCSSCSAFDVSPAFDMDLLVNNNAKAVHRSWVKVGISKTYTPTIADFGYRLKLEVVPTVFCAGIPWVPAELQTNHVIVAPPPRYMIPVKPLDCFSNFNLESQICADRPFSVLSYNVLADISFVSRRFKVIILKTSLSPSFKGLATHLYISEKRRGCLLIKESTHDGCATFFRFDKFRQVEKYELEFNTIAQELAESLDEDQRHSMMKNNVALITILETIETEPLCDTSIRRICVANVHVSANPQFMDVKLWQVGTLIEGLERIVAHSYVPVLIYGDLNSLPRSAAHNLLVNGKVNPMHEDLVKTPYEIFQHLKLSHELPPLASAYSSFSRATNGDSKQWSMMNPNTQEPRFTIARPNFRSAIDYIFYTEDMLTVRSLLELVHLRSAIRDTAFPSAMWPSDHIALMAEFSWKTPRQNQLVNSRDITYSSV
ncbi:carbon catabolite repressor protein 4 homolog 2-like [Papaver somniferum]|uniref:carbon catabolite repressor protein 4 homolog 2-like n=1 Tax=Papaver somniferum TaxID=3469 RepID=UPI000E6F6AB6|nr:carbon catabolite repressor protein 4 homolog 2-like [Papaver somniferum]